MNVSERISQALKQAGNARALEYEGGWATWSDVGLLAAGVQKLLASQGLQSGAGVALLARNRPAHVSALFALMASRYRTAMVYAALPEPELIAELINIGLPAVIADEQDWTAGMMQAMSEAGVLCMALSGCAPEPMTVRMIAPLTNTDLPVAVDSDIAIEMLSSGTTGKPKRVGIRHTTLAKAAATMIRAGDDTPCVDILPFPISNISGLYYLIPACLNQLPLVLLERFRLPEWLQAVTTYRPAYCAVPPPAIRMILDQPVPKEDLEGLAAIGVGAAPLEPNVQAEFEARYGVPILIGYGATEFGGVVVAWTVEDHRQFIGSKRGSVGRVCAGVEVRIVDPQSHALRPVGEVGVLEARVERIGPDWVATTDLARLDEDGFVFIEGRADDTINRGGFKVQPEKVEAALRRHPSVVDAAVVGEDDPRLGQVPVAVIELSGNWQPPTQAELDALVRDYLQSQEAPVRYAAMTALPRTASMKVRRVEVRSRLIEAVPLA